MAMKKKGRVTGRKGNVVMVNFSGVEAGRRAVPDGTYQAEVTSAELQEAKSSGNPMIVVKWKILSGKGKGATVYDNISLTPQALWKLRGCLEALGIEAQEDDVEASDYAEAMVGEQAEVTITNETYEGEQRPKVTSYGSAGEEEEETEEEEEEEEEPKVRNKKKSSSKKRPAKDEDEEEEEEEEEEDDDDSEEEEEEEEEDERPAPKKKKGAKPRFKEGDRVKFDDGEGNIVKGTITNIEDGEATVEDKAGDEYLEVPLSQIEPA
jgi:hypothetical protein